MVESGRRVLACLAIVVAAGCGESPDRGTSPETKAVEAVRASGRLVVATVESPVTYYLGRHGERRGPEYELVRAFADHLGVTPVFRRYSDTPAVLAAVESGEADLAAAAIAVTPERDSRFLFGPAYRTVTPQVVCRRGTRQPQGLSDFDGLELAVPAGSVHADHLRTLRDPGPPGPDWTAHPDTTPQELLAAVWAERVDCTIAHSSLVERVRFRYPELTTPFSLEAERTLAWAMPKGQVSLARAAARWMDGFREQGNLEAVADRYYAPFAEFDYVDVRVYMRRLDQRFPEYRAYFRAAAKKFELPYPVIAAQGYQESHWQADARSPTGVRGIMMLTRNTAGDLGVRNRTDPKESIFGGARYLAELRDRFSGVPEPDRLWLALAAYNVGIGHVRDAQRLARDAGLDPGRWGDIRETLPLLESRRFHRRVTHGYARGSEPVRYVRRIRQYRHVFEHRLRLVRAPSFERSAGGGPVSATP